MTMAEYSADLGNVSRNFGWQRVGMIEEVENYRGDSFEDLFLWHSGVLEPLMKDASSIVEKHKTDLFHELRKMTEIFRTLDKDVENGAEYLKLPSSFILLFCGLRKLGVDHDSYIRSRMEGNDLGEYKKLYRLRMEVDYADQERKEFRLILESAEPIMKGKEKN